MMQMKAEIVIFFSLLIFFNVALTHRTNFSNRRWKAKSFSATLRAEAFVLMAECDLGRSPKAFAALREAGCAFPVESFSSPSSSVQG